jgi:hypothetical protein
LQPLDDVAAFLLFYLEPELTSGKGHGFTSFMTIPSGYVKIAIENGHS